MPDIYTFLYEIVKTGIKNKMKGNKHTKKPAK